MASSEGDSSNSMEAKKRRRDSRVVVIYKGYKYDVTEFVDKHPGGRDVLVRNSGKDVTKLMNDHKSHRHSKAAYSILQTYKIESNSNGTYQNGKSANDNMHGWKEELVDWDKPMLAQVHKLGPDYMKWVHSPVDFKLRLFESQFVEFFSKTPWYMIPIIWIPVVLYFSFLSIVNLLPSVGNNDLDFITRYIGSIPLAFLLFGLCFALGIFVWSLVEYGLHRYLFHLTPPPDSPFWITLHFFLHGQHHKVPFDGDRLVFPPVAAGVFASFFYYIVVKVFTLGLGQGIFAGGLFGYVVYDLTHYYLHHGSPNKGSYLEGLKQYHVAHHFVNQSKGFGISSKFWDTPFGTLP